MLNEPITLVPQRLGSHYWMGNRGRWWSDGFESEVTIGRHHEGVCAQFWTCSECHTDTRGRQWATQSFFCVMDDFGNLQEVQR